MDKKFRISIWISKIDLHGCCEVSTLLACWARSCQAAPGDLKPGVSEKPLVSIPSGKLT